MMKKTRLLLLAQFFTWLALSVCLVVLYENDVLPCGTLSSQPQTEFLLTTFMELLTLAAVYLALRLFKFERVHCDLTTRKHAALLPWGSLRLSLLLIPMTVNTLLYYMFMNTTFGYMAIIQALCLPFVYPSQGRCLSEVEP